MQHSSLVTFNVSLSSVCSLNKPVNSKYDVRRASHYQLRYHLLNLKAHAVHALSLDNHLSMYNAWTCEVGCPLLSYVTRQHKLVQVCATLTWLAITLLKLHQLECITGTVH
jgi:hypothetical protein